MNSSPNSKGTLRGLREEFLAELESRGLGDSQSANQLRSELSDAPAASNSQPSRLIAQVRSTPNPPANPPSKK